MACVLFVPAIGDRSDAVELPIRVRSANLESNDHNHADTLSVTCERIDADVDPRLLRNATCSFWIGDADANGVFTPGPSTLRFCGLVTRARRSSSESSVSLELDFADYTTLFLRQKPFPSAGIPYYADTLLDAWRRICDHTGPLGDDGTVLSSVEALRDNIRFEGGTSPDLVIASAAARRFARVAKIPTKPGSDAWAVWQQCVGMLGLISYIDRDRCIVTTTTEHYDPSSAPRFIWGRNVLEMELHVDDNFSDKGVAIVSFDALTGKTIEAFYPPPTDPRVKRKQPKASVRSKKGHAHNTKAKPAVFESERYEYFEYHGVTDPDALEAIAKRVWEERGRQACEGQLTTAEMFVGPLGNVDVLSLRAGDAMRVEAAPDEQQGLLDLHSNEDRRRYMLQRGYSGEVADLIVRNLQVSRSFDPVFHALRVRTTLEVDGDGGRFEAAINFHNRIDPRLVGVT